ncbi:precorrin-6A/cobalt-precorrin-6A reductase [Roseovarius aquimarinus]|uniref:Precorrin-6A/cobalt-precorrin-6A reductase n=1 Tax=Roseovarius aquimarinus TaxID=1229156 RepID=A0ABW7I8I0_9RHOB
MTLLLMAGTGEARELAEGLAARGRDFTVWLPEGARITREWRGSAQGGPLGRCLEVAAPRMVLDASHPFDVEGSHLAARHCAARGLPYLLLRRPEWRAGPGDDWHRVASDAEAARLIAPGSTVLVASGREGLAAYARLERCRILCRQIGDPGVPFPLPNGDWLIQRPPFSVEEEIALFRELGIDWLVLRNAGSARAETKLIAARTLGLRVAMIARPAPPDAPMAQTVAAALAWVDAA